MSQSRQMIEVCMARRYVRNQECLELQEVDHINT